MSEYIVDLAAHNASAAMALRDGVHEEIVRCRDCKHHKDRNGAILPSLVCQRLGYHNFKVEPDGFCKWGERKEVDE